MTGPIYAATVGSPIFAPIVRAERQPGGAVVVEAVIDGDAATAAALDRAVGNSLSEMGRGEVAGKLLAAAHRGGRIVVHALVSSGRAARLAAEAVYKGLLIGFHLLNGEVAGVVLVDRPLGKSLSAEPQVLAVIYKRSEEDMSMISVLHKHYGTKPPPSKAEVDAVWQKMSPAERAIAEIKATLAQPATGGRDFLRWFAARANGGDGNPIRRGGEFK